MSSYNSAAVFGGGQPFSITLSDGSIFSFTLSGSSPNADNVVAIVAPAWTGAAVGNTAFLTIPNKPILYTTAGGTVNLTMSNIKVTPPLGTVSTGQFKLVVADAESTDGGESLTFTTNGANWTIVDQVGPKDGTNTYPNFTNTGPTFTETPHTGAYTFTGAYIVGSLSPTTVTVQLVAGGLQGIMFAVQYATISTNKSITGTRANPADQFTYGVKATSNGANITTATSSGAGLGPFSNAVATLSSGVPSTVYEQMAAGSVSNINQYTSSLTCTNGAVGSPTAMPTNLATTSYNMGTVAYGDAVACTFTNTPKPATVAIQKTTVGAVGGPFNFTVSNVSGAAPGGITTTSVGTATPAVPITNTVSAYNTAVTITETAVANFTNTAGSCTDANSAVTLNPASFGTWSAGQIVIQPANVLAGAQITCSFTNTVNTNTIATVALQKTTLGAAGGPFTFTATNLANVPAAITTSTVSTPYPSILAPISVNANNTPVVITETLATNFTVNSASCIDNNSAASGNPATIPVTLSGASNNVLTIPATNIKSKAQIVCTYSNIANPAIPTVAIQKITTGIVGGPFSFSATNLTGTPSNISTVTAGTAAPATTIPITVTTTVNPVTLTEAANVSFNISTGTCTDTNSAVTLNPASFGSLAGSVITVPFLNLKPFAKIVCTFTNAPKPATISVQKTTIGSFGGPFTFSATNTATQPLAITTTTAGTPAPAAPTAITISAVNTQVQITEAVNASYTTTSATCTDVNAAFTLNPANFGGLVGNVLTVLPANVRPAAQINCIFTNTAIPATVIVQKTTTGSAGGPFTFASYNISAAPAPITTLAAATPTPAAPAPATVTALNSVVEISEGSSGTFTFTSASCIDTNFAVSGNPSTAFGTISGLLLTINAANVLPAAQIKCTFTNAAIPATLAIQKITTGWPIGTFNFAGTNLVTQPSAITTSVISTPTPSSPTPVTVTSINADILLTEAANGSFTPTSATCKDINGAVSGNNATIFGTLAGNVLTISAANVLPAAQINCTFTNAAKPATVAVQKTTTGGLGGPFSFAVTNLATSPAPITTATVGTAAPIAPVANVVSAYNTAVQITETVSPTFTFTNAACTDANAAATGNIGTFVTSATNPLNIPAGNILPGAQINCIFTNAGKAPTISWQKAMAASGRLAAGDQFALSATGTGAPAVVNTAGAGVNITSGAMNFTATANTAYTLNEAMKAGSTSLLTAYAKSITCTNTNAVGTAIPASNSLPLTFTPQAGDAISCVVTNNGAATPLLKVVKTVSTPGPVNLGQQIIYTYAVTNLGNVAMLNVSVKDMHGTPQVQIPLGSGIKGDTLSNPGPLGPGASLPDNTANDGIWSILAPGATVTFTYTHTVTLAETDHG